MVGKVERIGEYPQVLVSVPRASSNPGHEPEAMGLFSSLVSGRKLRLGRDRPIQSKVLFCGFFF